MYGENTWHKIFITVSRKIWSFQKTLNAFYFENFNNNLFIEFKHLHNKKLNQKSFKKLFLRKELHFAQLSRVSLFLSVYDPNLLTGRTKTKTRPDRQQRYPKKYPERVRGAAASCSRRCQPAAPSAGYLEGTIGPARHRSRLGGTTRPHTPAAP